MSDVTPELSVAYADIARLTERVRKLEDAHERIVEWGEAYPLEVFPEPDMDRAAMALKSFGLTLDAVSASNMRHVITGVAAIARAALAKREG